jgi:Putative restriction endonuclease
MSEERPGYSLKTPGASGRSLHLPGRDPFPPIDEHLVEPEVTRDEIIGGRRVVAFPAEAPHADQHGDLQYVLRAHIAPGYVASVDLLTRFDQKSDFASDACVRREGVDPQTGKRYLEELAFEVVSVQKERDVAEKAPRMYRRGVRRIFAIFLKSRQVCEWSPEGQGSWRSLSLASSIEDTCLAKSLAVAALLDAAAADDAVVQALAAKDNPELRRMKTAERREGEAQGEARGIAKAILRVLERRGIAVSADQRQEILSCTDLDRLSHWLDRAIVATTTDEVLQG